MRWLIHHTKRVLRISLGVLLLILGVIGGFLPVLQGWVFILAGLAVLSVDFLWARRLREQIKDKAQKAVDKVRRRPKPAATAPDH
jgi:Flp pilus assembly protein TadB